MAEDNVLPLNCLKDMGSSKHKSLPSRGRRMNGSMLRIYLLGLLLLVLQTSVEAEQVLIWSQHSHLWTKLRGIYGQTNQWLQEHRKNFMTSESTRDQILDSLAYDHRTSYVYWHDEKTKSFYRQKADDSLKRRSTVTEKVYEGTSGDIGGMAFDWLTGNLFWTDRQLKQIRMTTKHPTSTDLVRVVTGGLIDPTNIAVDPVNVRLYWGEGGSNPRIMTSDMEGGDKRPLTQPNQVRKIVSLTLDLSDSIIYFVDEDVANSMSPKVKKLDLRTSTVSDVMSLSGRNYPGIAAHKDYIFLVDADFLEVQVYSKTNGNLIYRYVIDAFPHDIVISDTLDPRWNPPTDCDKLNCGDFCIRLITGEAQCRCRDKYYFRLDKRSCISSIPRFIYGMDGHLWDATADIASEFNVAELTPKLLTSQGQFQVIEAVGYHFTKDLVFFSDTGTNDIFRMEVEKRSLVQITANEYRVEGITVCWMSDTLYWTDSELHHIMLSKLDGRYHRQLLTNVGRPRGITCDALHGYLFFAEAEGNTIVRAYTDGTNSQTILNGIMEPQSIVVDPRSERIFWTQGATSQIHMADLDGGNKAMVMQTSSTPYGVTLFQDYVVWTHDAEHPKIGSKVNGQQVTVNVQGQQSVFQAQTTRDIVTFDHFLQPGQLGPCVANGGCKQLCFSTPDGQTCGCAIGYTLANDGKSCNTVVAERQFVLFVDPFHKAIYQYDTTSKQTHAVPMNNMDFPTSMDLEPSTGKVIYIDDMKRAIKSSYTNGQEEKDLWKYPDDREPKKVAYSPDNEMIYFIDGYPGKGGLYALPKDGGEPKPVVPNLIRPTAVAVDSKSGMIYYSVAGNQGSEAMIGSLNVDGTGGRIVASNEVQDPTDLAVLSDENMLFWSEMNGQIWSYNMSDQQPPKKLMEDSSKKILSISADNTLVYMSAYGTKSVMSLEWRAPVPQLQHATESIYARIYDIKAYPDIRLIPPPIPVVGAAVPFMWIGVGIAAVVLLALLLLLALCFSRKKPKKKSPKSNGVPGPAPPVVSASEEVEWGDMGHTNAMIHDNGGMSNGYHDEPDYQNFANGHPADIPVTTSAPVLNSPPQNGFDPHNLANAALVVASTGQLRKTDHYKKNEKQPLPVPVQPSFETNQKMSTMVERLAKRLRTGISSIRWTNGERDRDSRGSQPPEDIENQGDPDADPVGANKPKYAKRPPIGPFKPQLHRLPQGFAPASRVVPSNVKNTWGRNKKKQRGPQGEDS